MRAMVGGLLPTALVAAGAAAPALRLPVLAVLVAVAVALLVVERGGAPRVASGARSASAWGGPLPIALLLAWGQIPAPLAAPDGSDCGSPLSPPAVWRIAEAAVVLAVVGMSVAWLRLTRAEIGLRMPDRRLLVTSVASLVAVGPLAVVLGPWFASPFFGHVSLPGAGNPTAVVPAVAFAIANGTMEELAYRGLLQGALTRLTGASVAIGAQALLFGLEHSVGAEFTGSPLPVAAAMVAAGAVAGWIARRTRTLALPIALHVAFDIPLYYYWACRF